MSDLKPNVYAKGANLKIHTHNAYDTVYMQPIPNAIEESPTSVYSQEIISGNIAGESHMFPLTENVAPTFIRTMTNRFTAVVNEYTYAKARIEVIMATGSIDVTLDQPVSGIPTAELTLKGHSYALDKLVKTFEELPSAGTLTYDSNFQNWIIANGERKTSLTKIYDTNDVSLNPWVSRVIAYPQYIMGNYIDVSWYNAALFHFTPRYDSWNDASTGNATTSGPYQIYTDSNAFVNEKGLTMKDQKVFITTSVSKISDTRFKINWQAPVKYAYMAASRMRHTITGAWTDIDNKIFLDIIESITITLKANKRNTEVTDTYYSLDAGNHLTSVLKNNYIYSLEPSEVLTLETLNTANGNLWINTLAEQILASSEDGKYIFECEVPVAWARKHNVKIRSRFYVVQQNGEYIKRKTYKGLEKIMFEVMNITKYYTQNKFIYKLKLIQI